MLAIRRVQKACSGAPLKPCLTHRLTAMAHIYIASSSQTGATSAVLQLVTADPTETLPTLPSYVTATPGPPGVRRPRDSEPGKRPVRGRASVTVRRTGGQVGKSGRGRVLVMGAL